MPEESGDGCSFDDKRINRCDKEVVANEMRRNATANWPEFMPESVFESVDGICLLCVISSRNL